METTRKRTGSKLTVGQAEPDVHRRRAVRARWKQWNNVVAGFAALKETAFLHICKEIVTMWSHKSDALLILELNSSKYRAGAGLVLKL
jgi:hypothetical protein